MLSPRRPQEAWTAKESSALRRDGGAGALRLLLLCLLLASVGRASAHAWSAVIALETHQELPAGVVVHAFNGTSSPFDRPLPVTLEPHFVLSHAQQFNRLQSVVPRAPQEGMTPGTALLGPASTHSRYEPATKAFYIASVPDAVVDGPAGAVYDTQRRLYAPPGMFAADGMPPGPVAGPERPGRTRVPVLATVIQTYGWMYHHWVVETLPKLVLLRDAMPAVAGARGWNASHVRVLTWGQPWEAAWLDVLGIPRQATLTFDPLAGAAAHTLLLPSPVQVITPSAEALQLARSAVLAALPAAGPRDLVVFASRAGERSRAVANEAELLAALAAALPALTVAVHNRSVPVPEAVAMFSRAVVVVAPHGAGLSHILFCPPGTAVVELMFMRSPPMMFWHMAAALGLRYAMAPQPRSFWAQASKVVDVHEVVALLRQLLTGEGLPGGGGPPAHACAAGHFTAGNGSCIACAPGSYSPDSWPRALCVPCAPGRVALQAGSSFCTTCPDGTRSVGGVSCAPCPAGMLGVPLRGLPSGSPVPSSEVCILPPAELEVLASVLDESLALQPDQLAQHAAAFENVASRVEADVEHRMFSLHAAAQHPFGRRLGDRLYGDSSAYASMPGVPSLPPAPLAVPFAPPAPGVSGPSLSMTGAPPPVLAQPPRGSMPTPPSHPPPATAPVVAGNTSVPFTRAAASPWQLNAASITALAVLLMTATAGAILLVCRATRQSGPSAEQGQDAQPCGVPVMEDLPREWHENALHEGGDCTAREC